MAKRCWSRYIGRELFLQSLCIFNCLLIILLVSSNWIGVHLQMTFSEKQMELERALLDYIIVNKDITVEVIFWLSYVCSRRPSEMPMILLSSVCCKILLLRLVQGDTRGPTRARSATCWKQAGKPVWEGRPQHCSSFLVDVLFFVYVTKRYSVLVFLTWAFTGSSVL